MKRLAASVLLVGLLVGAAAPDCIYTAYGCTYVYYYNGDGTGDVLMSCDGGARWYSYSGRVGDCPLEYY